MTTIGYDQRAVTVDGARTLLLSGAIHYPRSTPEMWDSMMRRSREAGLNTIETYVFWNLHERQRGVFDFSGRLDLRRFCEMAQSHGLFVILRIGPYICAEINYGGFPAWLRDVPGIQLRTLNEPYQREMARWVRHLCAYLDGLYAPQGGPIIMAQIENEYNLVAPTYGEDGQRYLAWAIELGQSLELGVPWVMCVGGMPGAIETLNGFFVHHEIEAHRAAHPDQPALWTEHWPGWYDVWGQPHHLRTPESVAYGATRFIAGGGTGINYYMWHGGTNYGRDAMYLQTTSYDYTAPLDEFGLETSKSNHLRRMHGVLWRYADVLLSNERTPPQPLGPAQAAWVYGTLVFLTNDDPDAAAEVSFAGKAYRLAPRSVVLVADGVQVFDSAQVYPEDSVARSFVPAEGALSGWGSWQEPMPAERGAPALVAPQPVEQLRLTRDESDYCWYSTAISVPAERAGRGELTLTLAADFVYVYVDGRLAAQGPARLDENRSRTDDDLGALMAALEARYHGAPPSGNPHAFRLSLELEVGAGEHRVDVLCCALGLVKGDWMIGFQNMVEEKKGLWGPVLWRGEALPGPWELRPFLLGELAGVYGPAAPLVPWGPGAGGGLRWLRATFARPAGDEPLALDLGAMGKGLAWVNGQCVGRYWLIPGDQPHDPWQKGIVEAVGVGEPTQRYYHIPREWLRDENELVLFEEQGGDETAVRLCFWRAS